MMAKRRKGGGDDKGEREGKEGVRRGGENYIYY